MNVIIKVNKEPIDKINAKDVIKQLERILNTGPYGFFTELSYDCIGINKSCSNIDIHNKLLGLLMIINTAKRLKDHFFTTIGGNEEYAFRLSLFCGRKWEPLYDVLKTFPNIRDVNISFE